MEATLMLSSGSIAPNRTERQPGEGLGGPLRSAIFAVARVAYACSLTSQPD